jgi:hypothetical protein
MGFLDKAREAAAQATVKAQQGMAQGQAKIDELQTKRQADALVRELGAAYFAQQRRGGSPEAVAAALAAVDAHVAANGPLDAGSAGSTGTGWSAGPKTYGGASTAPPATPNPTPPPGGYGLDDV